ncbi:EamA family transporter RarD [Seongchinamella unica]|uniref:EamA family transporter RarD n=1 Tax=Seongchinamella unica TaxID=2547392 RepID=A0A4R5LP69_9GAMM|nr:EamA family transporter RarD [Seongchinamella unica]TDG12041.1 EamA family transporter RarD [Seongchinamella unica]
MPLLWGASSPQQRGTLLGVTAYLIWGFAALYWVRAEPVPPEDVLAHRAFWSLPFVCLVLLFSGRLRGALLLLKQPRTVAVMALAAGFGAVNWLIFLWAISNDQATEASLGYFLLPLVNVLIGLTLFGETVGTAQKIAIGCALVAVLLQLVYYGGLPWVALALPLSFGLYGAIRKKVTVESLEGLFIETLLMSPFSLAWLIYRDGAGLGQYGLEVDLVLLGAGAITAIPLITYVAASRLLPLTALGLVFYIGPTAQLLVAVLVFAEPFSLAQLLAFTLVWTGLMIVTVDNLRQARKQRRLIERPALETP